MEFVQPVAGADLYAIADDVARRSTLDAPRGRRQKQMRAGSHVLPASFVAGVRGRCLGRALRPVGACAPRLQGLLLRLC